MLESGKIRAVRAFVTASAPRRAGPNTAACTLWPDRVGPAALPSAGRRSRAAGPPPRTAASGTRQRAGWHPRQPPLPRTAARRVRLLHAGSESGGGGAAGLTARSGMRDINVAGRCRGPAE